MKPWQHFPSLFISQPPPAHTPRSPPPPLFFRFQAFFVWTVNKDCSQCLSSACLTGRCWPLGLLGAFLGIIKLKLNTGQTSCCQSALTKSKGWRSTSQSFHKTCETVRTAGNELPASCGTHSRQQMAEIRSLHCPLPPLPSPQPSAHPNAVSGVRAAGGGCSHRPTL